MISKRKFARTTGRRRAFRKQLAQSLIMYGEMITTEARAKDIRPLVERYISYAKTGQVSKFRALLAVLPKQAAEKLFYEIAPKYKDRTGGYLRIRKHAVARMRDGTKMATISFVK